MIFDHFSITQHMRSQAEMNQVPKFRAWTSMSCSNTILEGIFLGREKKQYAYGSYMNIGQFGHVNILL